MAIKKLSEFRNSSSMLGALVRHRVTRLLCVTGLIFTGWACSPAPAPPSKAAIEDAAQSGTRLEPPKPIAVSKQAWLYTALYPSGAFNLPRVVKQDIAKPIGKYPYVQPIVDKFSGLTIGPQDGLNIGIHNLATEGEYFITGDQLWTSQGRLYQVRFSKEVQRDAYIVVPAKFIQRPFTGAKSSPALCQLRPYESWRS